MLAFGLYSHIRANRIRTGLLLLCFAATVSMIFYSVCIIRELFDYPDSLRELLLDALDLFIEDGPWLIIGMGVWFIAMILWHHKVLDAATGAKDVAREEEPRLYVMLETLCISRGMITPHLKIIESDALNAYAAGLVEDDYCIALTRGLINTLTAQELESVIAHELTHIRNRDAQMMVVATVFVGFIGMIASTIMNHWDLIYRELLHKAKREETEKPSWLIVVIGLAIAILVAALSWGLSVLIRFAISRKREYLADAGAVELTKDPDALIRALRKIEGHAEIAQVAPKARAFFIETPAPGGTQGWFATHPTINERVAALVNFAGGRDIEKPSAATQAQRMVWRLQSKA